MAAKIEPTQPLGNLGTVNPPREERVDAAPPSPEKITPQVDTDSPSDFSDLDKQFKSEAFAPPAKEDPTSKKPDATQSDDATSSLKPDAKKGNHPAGDDEPKTPKELREKYYKTRDELAVANKTASQSIASLEAKIKDFEKRGLDTEALNKRLEAREMEFEALQAKYRLKEFETSADFNKNYKQPFDRAVRFAENTLAGLVKMDGATPDFKKDFEPIYRISYNAGYARAREVFGEDGAPVVMEHVRELQKLNMAYNEALSEEQTNWKTSVEREAGERVQRQETIRGLVQKVRKELQDTVEDYRDPVDDKEISELRKKGYDIFDAKPPTLDKAILRDEHVRHRVAAYAPMKLMLTRKDKEIASLKEQIEKLKPRVPGDKGVRNPGGERASETAEESYEDYLTKAINS